MKPYVWKEKRYNARPFNYKTNNEMYKAQKIHL